MAENSRPPSFSQDTVEDQYADFYYKHFGETFGHQPPEPDNQTQGRDQLTEINQQLAPTFSLASRQASATRDPIVENRTATTKTQASKKYKSRKELVEENVLLKTELLEMKRKCEALEEENRKLR